jgi:hypothetical protein
MTFAHRFSRTLSCTMTVSDEPPSNGARYIQNIEWTGCPKPKHTREYVRWRHIVNAHLAELWNFRIMEAIETGPRLWEFWGYAPGEPPKLLEKVES